jgi:hypothetical protein
LSTEFGLAVKEAVGAGGGGGGGGGGGATFFPPQADNIMTAPNARMNALRFNICWFTFSSPSLINLRQASTRQSTLYID